MAPLPVRRVGGLPLGSVLRLGLWACAYLLCFPAAAAWAQAPESAPPVAVATPRSMEPPIRVYAPTLLDARLPWSSIDGWGGGGWQIGGMSSAHYASTSDEKRQNGTIAQSGIELGQSYLLVQAGMVSAGKHPFVALVVRQVAQWPLAEVAGRDLQIGLYAGRLALGSVVQAAGYGSVELLGLRVTSRDAWVLELGVPLTVWVSDRGGSARSVGVAVRASRLFSWKDLIP